MPEPDLFTPRVSGASYPQSVSGPTYLGDGPHGDPWDGLRDYQQECLQAIDAGLKRGVDKQLIVMGTGLGKGHLMARMNRHLNLGRQMVILHGIDLVEQIASYFRVANPGKKVQLEMGSWRADLDADIVVASVDTLGRSAGRSPDLLKRFPKDHFGLIHIDESHMSLAPSFVRTLKHFEPELLLGHTATPYRSDCQPLANIYDEVIFERDLAWAQEHEHLCAIHAEKITTKADLRDVHMRGGDFDPRDLAAVINTDWVNSAIISGIEEHALSGVKHKPRHSIIVFCVDKDHAESLAAQFRKRGHLAQEVLDHTPRDKRGEYLNAFRAGDLRFLTTCFALGQGVDLPRTDCVVMARPIKFIGRYLQFLGRGTRKHPDKDYLLVLDMNNVCGTMRPLSATEAFGVRDIDCLGEDVFEVAKLAKEAAEAGAHVHDGDTVEDVKLKFEEVQRISKDTVHVETYAEATALFGHMTLEEEVLRGSCFPWVRISDQSYTLRAWKCFADLCQNALGQWDLKLQGQTHHVGVTARPLREADRLVKKQVAEWRRFKLDAKKGREAATWPQIMLLRKFGWSVLPAGLTKGSAGHLIAMHQAYRRKSSSSAK